MATSPARVSHPRQVGTTHERRRHSAHAGRLVRVPASWLSDARTSQVRLLVIGRFAGFNRVLFYHSKRAEYKVEDEGGDNDGDPRKFG